MSFRSLGFSHPPRWLQAEQRRLADAPGTGPQRELEEVETEIARTREAIASVQSDITRNDDTISSLLAMLMAGSR